MTYTEVATEIVKESIKSVIYIDDKAWEPYNEYDKDLEPEQGYSRDLMSHFKKNGISLSVYQYDSKTYPKQKEYLFSRRDLVILDWKLQRDGGEDKALELMADIVNERPSLNYCAIYTSEDKIDKVMLTILHYFSGVNEFEKEQITEAFSDIQDDIVSQKDEFSELCFLQCEKTQTRERIKRFMLIPETKNIVNTIRKEYPQKDSQLPIGLLVARCHVAFSNSPLPKDSQPTPTFIDRNHHLIQIKNTIFVVINKTETIIDNLVSKFAEACSENRSGFLQLAGIALNNVIRDKGSVVAPHNIAVPNPILGFQKEQKGEAEFQELIENLMLDDIAYKSSGCVSKLVSALDGTKEAPSDNDMLELNILYNTQVAQQKNRLGFGDLFECQIGNEVWYYLSISRLCDFNEIKENHLYYFAKAQKTSPNKALEVGDKGYVSFLNSSIAIRWDMDDMIRPVPCNIEKVKFDEENSLQVSEIDGKGKIEERKLKYIQTIKRGYTQRIANKAFTYNSTVGVNFVRKGEKTKTE